jgi:putative SOS response-associated peptidase YedK
MDAVSRTRDALLAMVQSREWEGMTASPVSTYVNNPGNEGRQCIEPVEPGKPAREDTSNPDSAPFKLE